jgi:geranylgeranyl diphosphate synthase, type II
MEFNKALDIFESHLAKEIFIKEPHGLYDPVAYTLENGGKRMRPAMVLMASSIFKTDVSDAIMPAMAIEILHNFTLLHDDIMDKALVRRGKPSVHTKWDENTAILSGDAMLMMAYQYLSKCNPNHLAVLLKEFTKAGLEVCEGQQYDMDFERKCGVTTDDYIEMIRLKTAVLVGGSLKIGAITGDATPDDANGIYDFGIHVGLAFQIMDDILDVYGDFKTFGKATGGDIVSNKKTYLLLKALELADADTRVELERWINKKEFDRAEKINSIKDIYDKTGVKRVAGELMDFHYHRAMSILDSIGGNTQAKDDLMRFTQLLMKRTK